MAELHEAARRGDTAAVKLLLERGSSANAKGKYDQTPLHLAAEGGHTEVVKLLLGRGAEVNVADEIGSTVLQKAASGGHAEIVRLLLDKGASQTTTWTAWATPLGRAAQGDHWEVVQVLLENGADANERDGRGGRTPLHYAAASYAGDGTRCAKLLLEKGAIVGARNDDGETPLAEATKRGNVRMVSLLLDKGAYALAGDAAGMTPLHIASFAPYSREEIMRLMLEKARDVKREAPVGRTNWATAGAAGTATSATRRLYEAARAGDEATVRAALLEGADPNGDGVNCIPLVAAAERKHVEVVEALLSGGADPNPLHASCGSPLSAVFSRDAAGEGKLAGVMRRARSGGDRDATADAREAALVRLLLAHRADPNPPANALSPPPLVSAADRPAEVVGMLLAAGADVDTATSAGYTALRVAASHGNCAVVALLADHGAELDPRDDEGSTPLLEASGLGHEAVVRMLVERGADPKAATDDGWTALHFAAEEGWTETSALLLEKGADASAATQDGWTPLHGAAMGGSERSSIRAMHARAGMPLLNTYMAPDTWEIVVSLLLEHGADPGAETIEGASAGRVALSHGNLNLARLLGEEPTAADATLPPAIRPRSSPPLAGAALFGTNHGQRPGERGNKPPKPRREPALPSRKSCPRRSGLAKWLSYWFGPPAG